MKNYLLILILLLAVAHVQSAAQPTDHWETAVFNNDIWKYFVGTSEPNASWRSTGFDDSAWPGGPGGFGYGDNDDNTIIPQCTSVFIRITFNVPDTAYISEALLNMDYDDAFVAYLNDVEIGRAGITGVHPAFDQAGADHEARMYSGGLPESFPVSKDLLKKCLIQGNNVLSIQIHNSSLSSSDLTSNAWLSFGIKTPSHFFRTVPSWFSVSSEFFSSNLPIVIINTDNQDLILDSPRRLADMKIIYRGEGKRNFVIDKDSLGLLNYNGRISIEIRGSSSQTLPKKQYGLTTLKADDTTKYNVSLLGMPEENDWILNGLGFDPSLMRDRINYKLSRMIGEYAARTRYCEVMINGAYQGLYLLEEKIKVGKDRVDVTKIEKSDNTLPAITGGYITKSDKTNADDPVAWTMSSYLGVDDVMFIHVLPKPENVTNAQNNYIKSVFSNLSGTAYAGNTSFINGYPSVIDVPSFVDYIVLSEISANADAYQFSTYFHKDRNGKLRAGPLWDTNLTYGYDLSIWGFDRSHTDTWQFSNGDNEGAMFWKDLFRNEVFKCYVSRRWNDLTRTGQPLSLASIWSQMDTTASLIAEASIRENLRWGTAPDVPREVEKMKDWLNRRYLWMTSALGPYSACSNVATPPLVITKIMYNPDSTLSFPNSKDQEFIEIKNTGTSAVSLDGVYFKGTGFVYQFPPYSVILPNSVKILASNAEVFRSKYGFPASGQFTRNLNNKGEDLLLADGFGNTIDSISYSNLPPWPNADGNGYYLELIDPLSDNSLASNWTASTSTLVSVGEVKNSPDLVLYPVPVRSILNIQSSEQILSIHLMDFQGKLIKQLKVDSETYSLDMSPCRPGMYLIEVFTRSGNVVHKVIKE